MAGMTASGASAAVVKLTFEGIANLDAIGDFYNGGAGGNFGVTFSDKAQVLIDSDACGTGAFGGEPSPSTVLRLSTDAEVITMTLAAGFTAGVAFFYSVIGEAGTVTVYDGPNATGNVLATSFLLPTPFNGAPDPEGVSVRSSSSASPSRVQGGRSPSGETPRSCLMTSRSATRRSRRRRYLCLRHCRCCCLRSALLA